MLFAVLGHSCFRAPPADCVGEPMPEAPQKVQQIAGRNSRHAGRPRARSSTLGRCFRCAERDRTATNPRCRVADRANIPVGDAVAEERPSGVSDALSVRSC